MGETAGYVTRLENDGVVVVAAVVVVNVPFLLPLYRPEVLGRLVRRRRHIYSPLLSASLSSSSWYSPHQPLI